MAKDNVLLKRTFHPFSVDIMYVELRWNIVTSVIQPEIHFYGEEEENAPMPFS
jgi:hypothetical protein